jgi:hypothetical protein
VLQDHHPDRWARLVGNLVVEACATKPLQRDDEDCDAGRDDANRRP